MLPSLLACSLGAAQDAKAPSASASEGLRFSQAGHYVSVLGSKFNTNRTSMLSLIGLTARREHAVEVGSLLGVSTRVLANTFARVTSVDAYQAGYDADDINAGVSRLALARDLFSVRFFDDPKVTQLRTSSAVACQSFQDGSIDFVFLDAGHNYQAISDDLACWVPKVRDGGVVSGDDYLWPRGDVRRAVHEASKKRHLHVHVYGERWALTKKQGRTSQS